MSEHAIKRHVGDVCDQLWEEEIDFLRALVRRPSLRGQTNPVQQFIADQLRDMGLRVSTEGIDVGRIAELPGYSPAEWSYDGLVNVVGTAPGVGAGGRSIVLNGHVDVVSPEPVAHWRYDPWSGDIADGKMFGRGAADMKAGIAAMMYALKAVRQAGVDLAGDVVVQTVIDEECSGNGTLACLAAGHRADAAVVPEPTQLAVVTAHPGVLWCRIHIRGRGAHAESASTAVNAAEKAFLLVPALRALEAERNRPEHRHAVFAGIDHPLNFNVGTVHAGDWPSTVPEVCTVEVRASYYPDESMGRVKERIRETLLEAAHGDPWMRDNPPEVTFFGFQAEPAIYDMDREIVRILARNHAEVTGTEMRKAALTATVDNRFFELYYGIPSVCYGPMGGRLHAPDEWVDLRSMRDCTRALAGLLVDWCGTA